MQPVGFDDPQDGFRIRFRIVGADQSEIMIARQNSQILENFSITGVPGAFT